MKPEVAMATAQAYAWGWQDATNTKDSGVSYAFAVAFAEGYRRYDAAEIGYMVSVSSAYATWLASAGRTIFHSELTSAEMLQQHATETGRCVNRAPAGMIDTTERDEHRNAGTLFGGTNSNADLRTALAGDASAWRVPRIKY